jgi:hypothetical protein
MKALLVTILGLSCSVSAFAASPQDCLEVAKAITIGSRLSEDMEMGLKIGYGQVRVYAIGSAVTQNWNPSRLNIVLSGERDIISVLCK